MPIIPENKRVAGAAVIFEDDGQGSVKYPAGDGSALGGVAAEPSKFYGADEENTPRTATSYTTKLTRTWTLQDASYELRWSYEGRSTHSSTRLQVRISFDGVVVGETDNHPDRANQSGYGLMSGFVIQQVAAGARTVTIEFASSKNKKQVDIRRVRVSLQKVTVLS